MNNINDIIIETKTKKYNNEIIIQKDDNDNLSDKQILKINLDNKFNKTVCISNNIIIESKDTIENLSDDNSDNENSYNNTYNSSPKITYIKYINNIEEQLNLDLNLIDLSFIINNKNNYSNTKSKNIDNKELIINKYFNKLNILVNINIQKSINWCKKHEFTINKEFNIK